MDKDVYDERDWGIEVENYLGNITVSPFYAIEWIKVRPRILQHHGCLVESKVVDETESFLIECAEGFIIGGVLHEKWNKGS